MKPPRDIHQHVTDQIVSMLETCGAWERPWHRASITGDGLPVNAVTRQDYHGVNVLALWVTQMEKGYGANQWASYRQWQGRGAQVRKGERAAIVVFYKTIHAAITTEGGNPVIDDDGNPATKTLYFARASSVFNAEQVDGYTVETAEVERPADKPLAERMDTAERFVGATRAVIRFGGNRAFYAPSTDQIQMPPVDAFRDTRASTATETYYGTLLHELTHWTGHPSRCDRKFGSRFGDQSYAFKELVAELGAAFLCAGLGVSPAPREDHAAYLKHWLAILKSDKRAIFTAASTAQRAVDHLKGLQAAPVAVPLPVAA